MTRVFSKKQNLDARIMLVCVMILFFRGLLDFLYADYITKFYAYQGFQLHANSIFRFLQSYAIILILGAWLALALYQRRRPSGIVLALYFVVVMIPLSSLYGLADAPLPFVYAASACFTLVIAIFWFLPRVRVPRPGRDLVYLGITTLLGMSLYTYGYLLLTGGLSRFSFDLLSVYAVRAEYAQTRGPFIGYFVPWQAHVFNIVLFCLGLLRRNRWLLSVAIFGQLLLFGMTGHKSFLLAPALTAGVYLIWQKKNFLSYILGGAFLLALGSYVLFLITGNEFVPSLFVRRLFFVPANLHVKYYEFFSQPEHPFYMLSDSILKPFIENPYGQPMVSVIAHAYWGREFWPDVGYLGDAYGNFGFLGMFLFSAILGVMLCIVDSIGSRLPPHFVAAMISMPAMAITESALFTSMLTHGLIPAVLVLWILNTLEARQTRARLCGCTHLQTFRMARGK
ncbi:hypothetical protein DRQ15_00820 [candidate division KSB1 bacterium]|nr:MAG: hypothetical protein DRQ15_00820 [candidate division KSB1 bacterium]